MTAAPGRLRLVRISGAGEQFTIHIEDEAGTVLDLAVSRDQLDMLADEVDDALLKDESDDEA